MAQFQIPAKSSNAESASVASSISATHLEFGQVERVYTHCNFTTCHNYRTVALHVHADMKDTKVEAYTTLELPGV